MEQYLGVIGGILGIGSMIFGYVLYIFKVKAATDMLAKDLQHFERITEERRIQIDKDIESLKGLYKRVNELEQHYPLIQKTMLDLDAKVSQLDTDVSSLRESINTSFQEILSHVKK